MTSLMRFSRRRFLQTLSALPLVLAGWPVRRAWAAPLYDFSSKAAWDALYEIGAEGAWGHPASRAEVNLNYHRFVLMPVIREHAKQLRTALGWTNATPLIVVSPGFGWIMEALGETGMVSVVGATTAAYIQNEKGSNEDADVRAAVEAVGLTTTSGDGLTLFTVLRGDGGPRARRAATILNEELRTAASRNLVKAGLGTSGPVIVLTYDGFLNAHDDASAVALAADLRRVPSSTVVHHVYRTWLNGKSLADWKALIPQDLFVEHGTWQVM